MPAMTALPVAPNRNDPDTFAERADDLVAALPGFVDEANALAEDVTAKAAVCTSAAMAVAVTGWVSGTTYAQGVNVWDPVTLLTYRRKVPGAGTTRPALDPTNWALLTGFGDVDTASAQTITGQKTFSQEILGTARDCSRSITVEGLATGGGPLNADRVVNVPKASKAEAEAFVDDAKAMTPFTTSAALAKRVLGEGQTWGSVTRTAGTVYQNTTGRTIFIAISGTGNYTQLLVGEDTSTSVRVAYNGTGGAGVYEQYHISAPIPAGWYYKITGGYGEVRELR